MKTIVLYGAGQLGRMVSNLAGENYRVLCFADGNPQKHHGRLNGIEILSPEESAALNPDVICLCAAGEQRRNEMRQRLIRAGYRGVITDTDAMGLFDPRFGTMRLLARQIDAMEITGDVAELGVFRGGFASQINAVFPDRQLLLFDTFEGFDSRDVDIEQIKSCSGAKIGDFSDTGIETVRAVLPHPEKAEFRKGWFPDSFDGCEDRTFAFVSIDADLYAPTAAALPIFYDRLSPGGAIMIHDYDSDRFAGAGQAVREFCSARKIIPFPVCDLHGSAVIRKQTGE